MSEIGSPTATREDPTTLLSLRSDAFCSLCDVPNGPEQSVRNGQDNQIRITAAPKIVAP